MKNKEKNYNEFNDDEDLGKKNVKMDSKKENMQVTMNVAVTKNASNENEEHEGSSSGNYTEEISNSLLKKVNLKLR